ncbi:MAG: hypothetical protein ACLP22_21700 [Solirubrobacteraceae bacterium]
MSEHQAARTLVKSAPELWEACSEESSLARHLKPFGEIRITRLEPETAVAWEGDCTSGTVRLEPSGWGTRVTLTARAIDAPGEGIHAEPEPEPEPEVEPQREVESTVLAVEAPVREVEPTVLEVEPAMPEVEAPVRGVEPPMPYAEVSQPPLPTPKPHRPRFWARLRGRHRAGATLEPVAVAVVEPAPEPVVVVVAEPAPEPVVVAVAEPAPEPVVAVEPAPEPVAVAEPPTERVAIAEPDLLAEPSAGFDPVAALTEALDSLGRAHHRPFSRG